MMFGLFGMLIEGSMPQPANNKCRQEALHLSRSVALGRPVMAKPNAYHVAQRAIVCRRGCGEIWQQCPHQYGRAGCAVACAFNESMKLLKCNVYIENGKSIEAVTRCENISFF